MMRVGVGYDVHRFEAGRPLILGGVEIPFEKGLAGHSDADVLAHAVCDALLGAAALGDIGGHFPDTDSRYAGADSMALLREVAALVQGKGFRPHNVDAVVVAERPKLAPHIGAMRERLAGAIGLSLEYVSVKATTSERLGFAGREEGIAAQAVCTLLETSG
ncbi:MAG: 2-C-methyl-D-erythritol 2,4-cyclodiphosphate synthase [bacterium]|nr:2-C-methyl-D-erythritol 2,4-cyclodiphosphate synthase [bacterium]